MPVFRRGSKWYIELPDGRQKSTGLDATEENRAKAEKVYEHVRKRLEVDAKSGKVRVSKRTVNDYFEWWAKQQTYETKDRDYGRLKRHAMPKIGKVALRDIKPKHIRELMDELKAKVPHDLAPRTVRHVYQTLKRMFRRAEDDEDIDRNPCTLRPGELPAKVDQDPEWRANARFERHEVEALISDPRIPEDRRVVYAIIFMTGARIGEVIALRWRDLQAREPLDLLLLARSWNTGKKKEKATKTGVAKQPPVHPTLKAMLDAWRASGWARRYGRTPADDDLIVPQPLDRARGRRVGGPTTRWSADTFRKRCYEDLKRLEMRRRSPHDGRSTFISLTMEDGCNPHIMERITHPSPVEDARDGYHRPSWRATCAEVLKYKISPPASGPEDPRPGVSSNFTDTCTDSLQAPGIIGKKMEPVGIEPGSSIPSSVLHCSSSSRCLCRTLEGRGRMEKEEMGRFCGAGVVPIGPAFVSQIEWKGAGLVATNRHYTYSGV